MTRIRSLLLVEEKLGEAEYFAIRLRSLHIPEIVFELNAFLSAARSVTFLLQKELPGVDGFDDWLNQSRNEMGSDPAMKFFKDLRNLSQHEGRVSLIGTSRPGSIDSNSGRYMFAANNKEVPEQLVGRNVSDCCLEHIAKLAKIVLGCASEFPFHSCPSRAVTVDGLKHLGLQVSDVLGVLGHPPSWMEARPIPKADSLKILARQFDWVDFDEIRRISQFRPLPSAENISDHNEMNQRSAQNLARRFGRPR